MKDSIFCVYFDILTPGDYVINVTCTMNYNAALFYMLSVL